MNSEPSPSKANFHIPSAPEFKTDFLTPESLRYEKETLQVATNNFSINNEIGRGGFGVVYKVFELFKRSSM
ncbi:Cysteine-rich receptor-like protein kinase 8 [Bienertia sinuspersici]